MIAYDVGEKQRARQIQWSLWCETKHISIQAYAIFGKLLKANREFNIITHFKYQPYSVTLVSIYAIIMLG